MATQVGSRLPANLPTYEDTLKWLIWDQFPVVMDTQVRLTEVLPQVGIYNHFNSEIKQFDVALRGDVDREFTIAGVGSLFDYDRFGHIIKRPTPQLQGSGCNGNSLCLEPTCFGFTEGVIENNNVMQDMCWSLSMPCLKDMYYSDRRFTDKMMMYFSMFFKQPPAVIQAYQRTRLLKEAIKVICTDKVINYTGALIGGSSGIALPFYISPTNPFDFPLLTDLPAGIGVGGANLQAFMSFVGPRFFSGSFAGEPVPVQMYGLRTDFDNARMQTASVQDNALSLEAYVAMGKEGVDRGWNISGANFKEDALFPTFKINADNQFELITKEIMELSTIAGYVQADNPEHNLAKYRGLLFVPNNWKFNLVTPPKDDFSFLGLGQGLNFGQNTPGVYKIMSSSSFTNSRVGTKSITFGSTVNPKTGMVEQGIRGLEPRERIMQEAIRTELMMTYSTTSVNDTQPGQLPNVGRPYVPQKPADGFSLKSTMYVQTDVYGAAKPVLLLFLMDVPRAARAIAVCSTGTVTVTASTTGGTYIVSASPGNATYLTITFNKDVSAQYAVGDKVAYRTGARGMTFLATVTAVSGSVVTISSSASPQLILPTCSGSPDDYGRRAELLNYQTVTNRTSPVFKGKWDAATSKLLVELLVPVVPTVNGADATLRLEDGTVVLLDVSGTQEGVFNAFVIRAGSGETCDLSTLTCNCLDNATITID